MKGDNVKFRGSLLAFDVDGTLLNSQGQLTERTVTAISSARDKGATVILATGRSWSELQYVIDAIPDIEYAICTNGLEAYNRLGEVLYTEQIQPDLARELVTIIRSSIHGVAIGAGIGSELFAEPKVIEGLVPGIEITSDRLVDDIAQVLTSDVRDLLIYHPSYVNKLDDLFTKVKDVIIDDRVDIVYSGLPMIEIVPAGSGKGTCLAWLAQQLELKQENVFAFGDGMNDLSMLQWAGTGIAMGQSHQRVKASADLIIGSVDEEGIAEWIENNLSN